MILQYYQHNNIDYYKYINIDRIHSKSREYPTNILILLTLYNNIYDLPNSSDEFDKLIVLLS